MTYKLGEFICFTLACLCLVGTAFVREQALYNTVICGVLISIFLRLGRIADILETLRPRSMFGRAPITIAHAHRGRDDEQAS